MLRTADHIIGMAIEARDGFIGKVADLYFDDEDWTVRYLVADTGHWLTGPSVLISPHSVRKPDTARISDRVHAVLPVDLTKDQVRNAPRSDTEPPVSRQFERSYNDYYGYPYYWEGPYVWGGTAFPFYSPTFPPPESLASPANHEPRRSARIVTARVEGDSHLRSARGVGGYHIQARDGEIGHVEDLLLDDEDWEIRYIGVDTRNWLPGRTLAIPSEWAKDIRWEDRTVSVDHFRDEVRNAPGYHHGSPLTRELGEELERHFHGVERKG